MKSTRGGWAGLTLAAAADVEQTRLAAGAESLIRCVVAAVGEERLGRHVAVQGDALQAARPLVHQLH